MSSLYLYCFQSCKCCKFSSVCVFFKALICLLGSVCGCLIVRSQLGSHWFHVVCSWCQVRWQVVWHCGNYICEVSPFFTTVLKLIVDLSCLVDHAETLSGDMLKLPPR